MDMKWNRIEDGLPTKDGRYLVVKHYSYNNDNKSFVDILGFTLDAYHFDEYDFYDYADEKKPLFYMYDSDYGYADLTDYVTYWAELPEVPKE